MRALLVALVLSSAACDPLRPTACNKLLTKSKCIRHPDCGFCPGMDVACHEGGASGPVYRVAKCSDWVFDGLRADKPPANGHHARAWLSDELRSKWLTTEDGEVPTVSPTGATDSTDANSQATGSVGSADDSINADSQATGPTDSADDSEHDATGGSGAEPTGATGTAADPADDGAEAAGATGTAADPTDDGAATRVATGSEGENTRNAYHGESAFRRLDEERTALLRHRRHLSAKLKKCMHRSKELERVYEEALESLEQALELQHNMRDEMRANRKKSAKFSALAQAEKNPRKEKQAREKSRLATLQAHMSVLSMDDANKAVALRQQLLAKAKHAIKTMTAECGDEFKTLPVLFSRIDMLETEYKARRAVKEAVDATSNRYHRLFGSEKGAEKK